MSALKSGRPRKIQFLCQCHRTQLSHNRDAANAYWQQWMKKGREFKQAGNWQKAYAHFGFSMDLAELIIDTYSSQQALSKGMIEQYTQAGFELISVFESVKYTQWQTFYLQLISAQLKATIDLQNQDKSLTESIKAQLERTENTLNLINSGLALNASDVNQNTSDLAKPPRTHLSHASNSSSVIH